MNIKSCRIGNDTGNAFSDWIFDGIWLEMHLYSLAQFLVDRLPFLELLKYGMQWTVPGWPFRYNA